MWVGGGIKPYGARGGKTMRGRRRGGGEGGWGGGWGGWWGCGGERFSKLVYKMFDNLFLADKKNRRICFR